MLYPQHITFIKIQLLLSKLSFCLPLEWNSKSKKLQVISFKKRKVFWSFLVMSTCLYISRVLLTMRVMYNLYQPGYERKHHLLPYIKHQALDISLGVFIFCLMQMTNTTKRFDICHLMNALIDFEIRHEGFGAKITESVLGKFLLAGGCVSSISAPLFMTFLVYLLPCIPPLYGSLILPCPDYNPTAVEMVLVMALEIFTDLFAWTSGMWIVFIGFLIGIICLKRFVDFTRSIPFTINSFKMFREIKQMVILFNSVHQDPLLPLFLVAAMICPSISIFLCIGFHTEMPIPLLGFLLVVTFDGMFVILFYLFGYAGRIYGTSYETIEAWRHDRQTQRDKLAKRCLRSVVPIKIRFGATNFMDRSTCLVCVQFSVNQAASMLLASKR